MKNSFKIMAIFILSIIVSSTGWAEEKKILPEGLALAGEYRARAFNRDNAEDFSSDLPNNDEYLDSRFRLKGFWNLGDGYSINFRCDIFEGIWGSDNSSWPTVNSSRAFPNSAQTSGRSSSGGDTVSHIHFDRLFATIDKPDFKLNVGQQLHWFGDMWIYGPQSPGVSLRIKTLNPFFFDINFFKRNEGYDTFPVSYPGYYPPSQNAKDDSDKHHDENLYGIQVGYEKDNIKAHLYYATLDNQEYNFKKEAYGLHAKVKIDGWTLMTEMALFGGEDKGKKLDYVGTQGVVDASYDYKQFKIGGRLFYAKGAKDDEIQVTEIAIYSPWPTYAWGLDVIKEGNLVDEPELAPVDLGKRQIWDPAANNAGELGGTLYAQYQPMDKLSITGAASYLSPEDGNRTDWESFIIFNLSARYNFYHKKEKIIKEVSLLPLIGLTLPSFDNKGQSWSFDRITKTQGSLTYKDEDPALVMATYLLFYF